MNVRTAVFVSVVSSVAALACGRSSEPPAIVDASRPDGATRPDSGRDATVGCDPVLCDLFCEHGFARGPDGCEVCSCNPAPDDSCVDDVDCVLAYDSTGCCGCFRGHARARVDGETCLIERGETPPTGCRPDPMVCAAVDCAECEPAVRAICVDNACTSSNECPAGQVQRGFDCVDACAAHADCTLAANYGSCCGGCEPVPTSLVEADACLAERQSESTCAPPAGACDGLGCASPPSECTELGQSAVCMQSGQCAYSGPEGGCPSGSTDVDGVCVPD